MKHSVFAVALLANGHEDSLWTEVCCAGPDLL